MGTTTKVQSQTGSGRINQSFTADNGLLTVFAGARENPAFYNRQQLLQIIPNRNQGSNAPTCLPGGPDTCPQRLPEPRDRLAGRHERPVVRRRDAALGIAQRPR